jgi:hypothetical protein
MTSLYAESLDDFHDPFYRPYFFLEALTPQSDSGLLDILPAPSCRPLRPTATPYCSDEVCLGDGQFHVHRLIGLQQDAGFPGLRIADSESDAPSPSSPFFPGDWDFVTTGPYANAYDPRSPSHRSDLSDFEPETSDTDTMSESDSEAQYITIPYDSPWYKPPCATSDHSTASSPLPRSDSSDMSSTLASDSFIKFDMGARNERLYVLHEELRRLVTPELDSEFDERCFEGLDGSLLTAPARAFEETCWASACSSPSSSPGWLAKPIPDVPVDFVDEEDVVSECQIEVRIKFTVICPSSRFLFSTLGDFGPPYYTPRLWI